MTSKSGIRRPIVGVGLLAVALSLVVSQPRGAVAQAALERWVGDWAGTLRAGPQQLPIVFHLTMDRGELAATMDSPAQGAFAIPMDGAEVAGDSLTLTLRSAQATYRGVMREDGSIGGEWSQGPAVLPLDLEPAEPGAGDASGPPGPVIPDPATRPQAPRPPFPYEATDVQVPHGSGAFELAGTLTVPEGDGPFPGVVLVSGSGPQDRDETLLGHKPFAVLADHLTRRGIAVLRYDDRGVGESGGDFASATSADLATDAEAAVAWLGNRPEVDGERVGIVGHSEGGLIAPLVASTNDRVAFIVLLAGPGMSGEEIILDQSRRIGEAQGLDPARLDLNIEANRKLFRIVRETSDPEERAAKIRNVLRDMVAGMTPEERAREGIPEDGAEGWIQGQVNQLDSPWLEYFLTYDPIPALEQVEVPVLALNGQLDLQVPWEANLAAIQAALERGGNPDFTVESLPGLNHLFQPATTGAPSEYADIDTTMSPVALERVSDWIRERFGTR